MADEGDKVHYERIPVRGMAPSGSFDVPREAINALGGGDVGKGHFILSDMFGTHPMNTPPGLISPDVDRELGNGNPQAGHRVLQKFVAMCRRQYRPNT